MGEINGELVRTSARNLKLTHGFVHTVNTQPSKSRAESGLTTHDWIVREHLEVFDRIESGTEHLTARLCSRRFIATVWREAGGHADGLDSRVRKVKPDIVGKPAASVGEVIVCGHANRRRTRVKHVPIPGALSKRDRGQLPQALRLGWCSSPNEFATPLDEGAKPSPLVLHSSIRKLESERCRGQTPPGDYGRTRRLSPRTPSRFKSNADTLDVIKRLQQLEDGCSFARRISIEQDRDVYRPLRSNRTRRAPHGQRCQGDEDNIHHTAQSGRHSLPI
jgi:hypothetical protein